MCSLCSLSASRDYEVPFITPSATNRKSFTLASLLQRDLDLTRPSSTHLVLFILFLFLFCSCSCPHIYFQSTSALFLEMYVVDLNGFHFPFSIFDCE